MTGYSPSRALAKPAAAFRAGALPIIGAALIASGCATTPEPNTTLEQARRDYNALATQPGASRQAAVALQTAEQALQRADQAWQGGRDEIVTDHLAYLAARRVDIAEQTVRLGNAEAVLEQAGEARTEVQLQAQTQEARAAKQQAASAQARAQQLESQLKQLQAEQTERGTVVTLGDVLFDVDKAQLNPGGQRNVSQLAGFLNQNSDRQVLIEGFTDSTGSAEYNRQLSERRANAVRDALVDEGVDARRIRTRGYGEAYPVAANDSEGSRQLNRRVEVVISEADDQVPERR